MPARGIFLNKMAEIGFVHPDPAPMPEAARALPVSIHSSASDRKDCHVLS